MMSTLALTALLLLSPAAEEQRAPDPVFRVGLATLLASHGMDLWSTGKCIGAGTCHESNPMLRWAQDTEVLFGAVKMTGAALEIWLLAKVHAKSKKWGRVATFALAGVSVALAVNNARTARGRHGL